MRANSLARASFLLLFGLLILGLAACGSDSDVAAGPSSDSQDDSQSVAAIEDTHEDDGDDHAVAVDDGHAEEVESDGHAHGHMEGPVDPDAPVTHITASEFAYGTANLEAAAGEAFTIQISNIGLLEHDITFEGLEDKGGLHVQPGEEGIGTFSINEAGEYTYYCTVLGHREAGMTGTLVVSVGHDVADGHHDEAEAVHDEAEDMHDEADGHHDEEAEAVHDEADGHHDEEAEAMHDEAEGHDDAEPAHDDADGHHEDAEAMHDDADASDDAVATGA